MALAWTDQAAFWAALSLRIVPRMSLCALGTPYDPGRRVEVVDLIVDDVGLGEAGLHVSPVDADLIGQVALSMDFRGAVGQRILGRLSGDPT